MKIYQNHNATDTLLVILSDRSSHYYLADFFFQLIHRQEEEAMSKMIDKSTKLPLDFFSA